MTMFAQNNNNKISYQAVVRNNANELVANRDVDVEIRIFNGDLQVYAETHSGIHTNYNGLISLMIGAGERISGEWTAIDWRNAKAETTVTLDGEPVGTLVMPLSAVPYALYSDYAVEINPNTTVIIDIQNKIKYDSLALSIHLNDTLNEYVKKDGLCNEVKACLDDDLSSIYEKIRTDSTAIYEKIKADSIALTNHINDTLSDYVKSSELCAAVNECVNNDLSSVYNKIHTDSVALAVQINDLNNYVTNNYTTKTEVNANVDSVKINIRRELADTASTLRGLISSVANSVHNSTVQFQINNENLINGSFTLNQSTGAVINIPVPTKVSDLQNDEGYITSAQVPAQVNADWNATTGAALILNKPENLAYTNSNNTFSGNNTFSATNTFSSNNIFSGNNTFSATNTFSSNNTFSGDNTFSGNNTFSGSITVPNAVTNLKTTTSNANAVNVHDLLVVFDSLTNRMNILHDSLANVLASLPKMNQQDSVIAETQTSTETVFTLEQTVNTSCVYRMYINGVMVGGSHNGVLVPVANEGDKVKYDGTKNGGKKLKANDKVTIVYWY